MVAEAGTGEGGFLGGEAAKKWPQTLEQPLEAPISALPPSATSSFPTCFVPGPPGTCHATTGHTQPVAAVGASPMGVEESAVAGAAAEWCAWAVLCPGRPLACLPRERTGSEEAEAIGPF